MIQSIIDHPVALVGLAAMVLSLGSIVLTIYQLRLQRRHNIQSVKPLPQFKLDPFRKEVSFYLVNKGLGPLIIKKLEFINNDVSVTNLTEHLRNLNLTNYNFLNVDVSISANEQYLLFSKTFNRQDGWFSVKEKTYIKNDLEKVEKDHKAFLSAISEILIRFEGVDIYDNSYKEEFRIKDKG